MGFMVGGGGQKTLIFSIKENGAGYLDLYYARIWEIQDSLSKGENIMSQISMSIPLKTVSFPG